MWHGEGRVNCRVLLVALAVVLSLLGSVVLSSQAVAQSVDIAVAASSDDAEENPSGGVSLTSSDLELVADGSTVQTVGLRFPGVTVPNGATVTGAYVQFQVDEVSTGAASLMVQAQATDNAATFTTATRNVSTRARTTASVPWSPPGWSTVGARGTAQQTPDLRTLIQEVVNRTGWASGNALAFIVTGSGRRTAEARDSGATVAPVLHVEYQTGGAGINRPPVVTAGPDQRITLPDNDVVLSGSVTDDGLPTGGTLTRAWSQVSGPSGVSFSAPNADTTTATFPSAGVYVLRLTGDDGELSSFDDVTVTVAEAGALPGTISGISPEAQGRIGPFIDRNGNLYTVAEISAADPRMKMMKSTNGGRTWSETDAANRPVRNDLEAVWIVQQGTSLYLIHQRTGARVYHHVFNTSDASSNPDKWTLKDEAVASPAEPSSQYVSLVILTNGDLWAFYGDGNRVGYRKKPAGGTWGAQRILDTVSTEQCVTVRGANDKTHIFYKDGSNDQIKHRSLTPDGTLSTAERVDDSGVHPEHSPMTNPVYYDDGGVETVVVAWADPTAILRSARVINDGAPTAEVRVSTSSVLIDPGDTTNVAAIAHLAVDGKTVHAVWSDATTADIFHDSNDDDAGWGTDTEIRDGVTAHWLYANVFTHATGNGGTRVLGYIYDNNTDLNADTDGLQYHELALTTG